MGRDTLRDRSVLLAAMAAVLLAACDTGMIRPDAPRTIRLTSDPPGATVRVSGREIGRTPLEVRPGDVFPSGIRDFGYQYVGTLEFVRTGCEPVRIEIDDAVAKRHHHVKLQCPAHTPAAQAATPPPMPDDAALRLRNLEALRKEGLITEDEYHKARQRILDAL